MRLHHQRFLMNSGILFAMVIMSGSFTIFASAGLADPFAV
jgi:hypothetical protein